MKVEKLCVLALILAVMMFFTNTTSAASLTLIKVEPYQNVAALGQQFTTNITMTDVQNLFGFEIRLYWNASLLQLANTEALLGVESHPEGVLYNGSHPVWINETTRSGDYALVATSIGEQTPSFNGSGTIAKLTFNIINVGNCELALQATLYDKPPPEEPANQIQCLLENGYYSPVYMSLLPVDVTLGESVNISGYVKLTMENITITVQYRQQGNAGWISLGNATIDSSGNYTLQWTPQKEGAYQIRAIATVQDKTAESLIGNVAVKSNGEQWFNIYLYMATAATIVIVVLVIYFYKLKRKKR